MHNIIVIAYFLIILSSAASMPLSPRPHRDILSREDLKLGMVSYTGNGVCRLSPRFSSYPGSFTRGDVRLWDTLLTRNVGTPLEPSIHPRVQLSTNPPSSSLSKRIYAPCNIDLLPRIIKKKNASSGRLAFSIFLWSNEKLSRKIWDLKRWIMKTQNV